MMMMIVDAIRRAQRQYPVDVIGLCRDLGISVHEAYLADDVSGELVPTVGGHFQINVNASHPKTRQRFTIAHELGHFVHHRNLIGTGIDDDRAYRSTNAGRYHNTMIGPAQETQANRFAANLLMPQHLIHRLQQEGKRTPEEQANALGVSRSAMRIRLGVPEPV